jgi:hypothetical protein
VTRAPIALFVYNRPGHTRLTVEALLANTVATQTPLHVFSDAPRNESASLAVAEVRSYIRSIAGFKSVTIIERNTNFGLARSIIDGVTRLCQEYGRVIVVEDDLVTSPYFLEYMNSALDKYEEEEKVMQIAGYMFPGKIDAIEDALFLPFISSWGWATWKRAWEYFDPNSQGYDALSNDDALRDRFNLAGHYDYFKMLQAQRLGKSDSWAIRWYLSVFLRNGLALYPRITLVRNMGFDGSGVNCAVSDIAQEPIDVQFRVSSMPSDIEVSKLIESVFEHMPAPQLRIGSILNRARQIFKASR